ncbi:hypothetical protein, partial [Streptomyces sp. NRRL B-24085]|uniref:hypothetical protein n=1 Tax=Streptomyces sp. NRRL B-24085 TaxID=1709476 RepID=UPI00131C1B72
MPVPSSRARLRSPLTAVPATGALLALLTLPGPAHAQHPPSATGSEQQILFKADRDPGYACF